MSLFQNKKSPRKNFKGFNNLFEDEIDNMKFEIKKLKKSKNSQDLNNFEQITDIKTSLFLNKNFSNNNNLFHEKNILSSPYISNDIKNKYTELYLETLNEEKPNKKFNYKKPKANPKSNRNSTNNLNLNNYNKYVYTSPLKNNYPKNEKIIKKKEEIFKILGEEPNKNSNNNDNQEKNKIKLFKINMAKKEINKLLYGSDNKYNIKPIHHYYNIIDKLKNSKFTDNMINNNNDN